MCLCGHAEAVIEGYYKDLFLDGGVLMDTGIIPAASDLALSSEYIAIDALAIPFEDKVAEQNKIMVQTDDGDWQDDNGVLIYPDGEPRFRMIFTHGGQSHPHADTLGPDGSQRGRDFYDNGGSFTGSCAGQFITGLGYNSTYVANYYRIWPAYWLTTNLNDSATGFDIPVDSPLLDYYNFGGDNYIASVYHNGGGYAIEGDGTYWCTGTEVLALYAEPVTGSDPIYQDIIGNVSVLAYKEDDESGRLVPCGGHPEGIASGERRDLQEAMLSYALDGNGDPTAKAELQNGIARQMNDNSTAGHEKIGDLQYHHFTVELPAGMARLTITLDGDDAYDLNLYIKKDDFAFQGEPDVNEAVNGMAADETLTIENPSDGTWYIAVKCATTITSSWGGHSYVYSGSLGVLNGVAYTITAEWNGPNGDLTYDGKVDSNDVRKLSLHWLQSNRHYRDGNLIGWWEFDDGDGNTAADSSGYGNTGTLYNEPNWHNKVLEFDGIDDYVQTADDANKLQLTGSYTLSVWLKADAVQSDWAGILAKCEAGSGKTPNHWSLLFGGPDVPDTTGKLVVWNGILSPTRWDTEIELSDISGSWHHIAVVRSMTTMVSYLDGQMVSHGTYESDPNGGYGHLNIGAERTTQSCYKGLIDDVSIYSYQLSEDEVRELSLEHPVGQLVGWWNFDDGTADDSSGNDLDGTLVQGTGNTSVSIVYDADTDSNVLDCFNPGPNPGQYTVRSYCEVDDDAKLNITDQITMAMWCKVRSFTMIEQILFTKGWEYGILRWGDTDGLTSIFIEHGSGDYWMNPSAGPVNDGNWHHVALTYDSLTGDGVIYIDGSVFVTKTWAPPLPLGTTTEALGIGGKDLNAGTLPSNTRGWDGWIDDVRLYDYVLSPSAVEWLYEGSPVPEPVDYLCFEKPIGDMNGDCKVDYRDFSVMASNWLESGV